MSDDVLGIVVGLLVALGFWWATYYGLRSGVAGGGVPIRRRLNPATFWTMCVATGLFATLGSVLALTSAFHLLVS